MSQTQTMYLDICVALDDDNLKKIYDEAIQKHNQKVLNRNNDSHIDAGFDLYLPKDIICRYGSVNKIDMGVKCSAFFKTSDSYYNTGYYMYPRSSVSKTPLRLANSIGVIDSGYRGNLIGMFDCIDAGDNMDYNVKKYDRLVQICSPTLCPIYVRRVEVMDLDTERGEGGFGSTLGLGPGNI